MFLKLRLSRAPGMTRSIVLLILLLVAIRARATQIVPLPNFDVQALDGSAVHSDNWPLQGKWLIIYVEPRCQPCVALLGRLNKQDFPQLPAWTIIIGGGMRPAEVTVLQRRFPDLASAQWFADPARNSSAGLKLQGAPATLGVQNRNVQWTMSGILPDPKHFQSALNTWCAQ
jgi:hypothetical protein